MTSRTIGRALFLVTVVLAVESCASSTPTHMQGILAAEDEPHGTIEILRIADITDERYPAQLLVIDGEQIRAGNRREWRLTPGKHTLGVRPSRADIERWAPNVQSQRLPDFAEGKLVTFTVEEGKNYIFGVYIKDFQWNGWRPMVFEKTAETE